MGATACHLHQDALGSTRLVTNGAILAFSSNFEPYGMDYAMTGEEAFQYTGKLLDVVDGLYYEGARYYDPSTGRFITQDSEAGTQKDPMSLNRYVYARDNPMKMVDPNGHMFVLSYKVDQMDYSAGLSVQDVPWSVEGPELSAEETSAMSAALAPEAEREATDPGPASPDPHGIEGTWAPFASEPTIGQGKTAVTPAGHSGFTNSCMSQSGADIFFTGYSVGATDLLLVLGGVEIGFGAALTTFGIGVPVLVLGIAMASYYYCGSKGS